MSSGAGTPGSAPKAMSSRLLTMKFMQRAAAASPSSSTHSSPDERSPKRRKTTSTSSPSKSNVDTLADRTAIQGALAAEEAQRQAALERQAAEAGDTRWVLNFEDQNTTGASRTPTLRVIEAGYANLDNVLSTHIESTEDAPKPQDIPVVVGRRSFGRFNQQVEV